MKIREIINEKLGEKVVEGIHSSGLRVYVLPKADYDSVYALFGVKYGSIDTFIKNENGEFEGIPAGTAHFLEHKLFESEDLNAMERFAETGASSNAFTSFERTAYLFKCSGDPVKSLEILLDFVQEPYFTEENVLKEQGIIGQEIEMYKDYPGWVVMFNLLKTLYHESPVKIDIAGTRESISEITAELLYNLYNRFYNPSNMVLTVAGGIEPEKVFETVEKLAKNKKGEPCERNFIKEDPKPAEKYIGQQFSVSRKQFMLGFKEDISKPELSLREEIASDIMLEAISGKSSDLFRKLMDAKLIDNSFSGSLFNGFGYSCAIFDGVSDYPEKVRDIILEEIEKLKKDGIDPAAFERAKRKLYSRNIMSYNAVKDIASTLLSLGLNGEEPFAEVEICADITAEEVQKRLEALKPEYSALSVVSPIG